MSKYTTGELAHLCDVSVRTVQYYDKRKLLTPSELSEGGRRLYSEEDRKRMELICFLRDTGLSLSRIAALLAEEDSGSVLSLLLAEQERQLRAELQEQQEKLARLLRIQKESRRMENFSAAALGDIAQIVKNRKVLFRVRAVLLVCGVLVQLLEFSTLLIWIFQGVWQPFVLSLLAAAAVSAWLVTFYFKNVDYICPRCHAVFKPRLVQMLFARHTYATRRLTCTHCGQYGDCVEIGGGRAADKP